MIIKELWRYPVKSMGGEQLSSTFLGSNGIPGDRAFALRQSGVTRNAKKFPQLMSWPARYDVEPTPEGVTAPLVTLPGNRVMRADDPSISAVISDLVGEPVEMTGLAPADDLDFYRRREKRTIEESRAVFGLNEDEPFPDVSGLPARVAEFATPPGTFFDCYPLLVMTTASLAALQQAAPDSNIDVRRFRPNILIETTETGFAEQSWIGRTLSLGNVSLSLDVGCPRCVMTTIGFDDLPRDTSIMRTLVKTCEHVLGVYAEITSTGTINVGDTAILSA